MHVYKQYDQASLDSQYNNRLHVRGFADYLSRWELLSRETENKLPVIKDIAYGNMQRETLDIFPAALPGSKTLVFIHGGYWQMLDKRIFHFVAGALHAYGVTTVLINYPLAPGASMDEIVVACREAITWIYRNISRFNGDPGQLYVTGHSAGGHLAAMLLTTNWKLLNDDLPRGLLKGSCMISGLFNLVPIQQSYLNQVLKMDLETANRNSPVRLEPKNFCPLIIAVGAAETQEFNDQSKELHAKWIDKGTEIEYLQLPQLNHFSIIESIRDPKSVLHLAMCEMMKLH